MTTTKHTPGPWRAQTAREISRGLQPDTWRVIGFTVYSDDGHGNGVMIPSNFENPKFDFEKSEAAANAALISASPELLAALIALTGAIHPQADDSPFIAGLLDAADAAIAKATNPKE